jgi:apolipoprotein D and lipocalin family protein
MKSFLLIFACFASGAFAQVISPGRCPKNPVVQNFDVAAYLGTWYEIQRYPDYFQGEGECVKAEYSLKDDGTVKVLNSMLVLPNTERESVEGLAVVSFPEAVPLEGKLNVTFGGAPAFSNYWVLDTDYTNYSVVWTCIDGANLLKAEESWILSRRPYLDGVYKDKVNTVIKKYLKESKYRKTIQDDATCWAK